MPNSNDPPNATYSAAAPWEANAQEPMTLRDSDRTRHEADKIAYNAEFGYIERRHGEIATLYNVAKIAIAVIAGLIMALGFYPIFVFIISVLIWRGLDEVLENHDDADRRRREMHGLD